MLEYWGQDRVSIQEDLKMSKWVAHNLVEDRDVNNPPDMLTHAEYIMRKAGLEEAQAGTKIAGRNINNIKYADDTTLMTKSEELKSLLMKVKEESEKVGLKGQHSEN